MKNEKKPMRNKRFLTVNLIAALFGSVSAFAQDDVIRQINEYGTFDRWCVREVKESSVIGGKTKYLYEFCGNPCDTLRTGKAPFVAPDGYLWRTNNVLANVIGVVKTNNTIFPEKRGDGYCARIETHIERIQALGINMDVVCQGIFMVGKMYEPIRDTKNPQEKVQYGFPYTGRPKGVKFDYKADVGHEIIRGTGLSKLKHMGGTDCAEVVIILQKRWEDEDGKIHALRVGTGIERYTQSVSEWQNGHFVKINYGDIRGEEYYRDYMGLITKPDKIYYATNSRGKRVKVIEEGWACADEEPNWMVMNFLSSAGDAFYGGVGNVLWIDNVRVVE